MTTNEFKAYCTSAAEKACQWETQGNVQYSCRGADLRQRLLQERGELGRSPQRKTEDCSTSVQLSKFPLRASTCLAPVRS